MMIEELSAIRLAVLGRERGAEVRLFNLDLHTSVIADLQEAVTSARLVSWNSSNHNFLFRPKYPSPDPVAIVNQRSWQKIDRFRSFLFRFRYFLFLRSFDGFIVTYPTAFLILFANLKRPILAVVATRFDWPMSRNLRLFNWYKTKLKSLHDSGLLTIVANNRGDAEFLSQTTGITPVAIVPSLCDYVIKGAEPQCEEALLARGIYLQSSRLSRETHDWLRLEGVLDAREVFPDGYSWADLSQLDFVFVVPYNISTMTLFELASLGVTVVIPDNDWLAEMALYRQDGALSELHFENSPFQKRSLDMITVDWWLERADFCNQELMPNVVRISKWQSFSTIKLRRIGAEALATRNERVRKMRGDLIDTFVEKCREERARRERNL